MMQVQQTGLRLMNITAMNLAVPKAAGKHERLFNKPALDAAIKQGRWADKAFRLGELMCPLPIFLPWPLTQLIFHGKTGGMCH
jgi:hypothetical protein